MGRLDFDVVRHALKTAQDHGFAEVEVFSDGGAFRARLQPSARRSTAQAAHHPQSSGANGTPDLKAVKSPLVGFYRAGPNPLEKGGMIKRGEVVAIVNALGIANDVESTVEGEIVEVLVQDGQAVEFGQVLAKVKG